MCKVRLRRDPREKNDPEPVGHCPISFAAITLLITLLIHHEGGVCFPLFFGAISTTALSRLINPASPPLGERNGVKRSLVQQQPRRYLSYLLLFLRNVQDGLHEDQTGRSSIDLYFNLTGVTERR
jgi:hypothetical protein